MNPTANSKIGPFDIDTIVIGDCLDVMRQMPDGCAHTCVTSPPYWGLRDYGIDGQLGLEKTPEEYVEHMVEIMQEVRRVLRDDGTLWLNLGDSYANNSNGSRPSASSCLGSGPGGASKYRDECDYASKTIPAGLKPKNLVGIPWRVAFALQADGWWLRSDIIWHKPNCMPESVRDRPTKAHEYVFLLAKSKQYYYDQDAIREETTDPEYRTRGKIRPTKDPMWAESKQGDNRGGLHNQPGGRTSRNRRTVWTISTKPFSGAHFATFPEALIEPCIKAGCPTGGIVFDPFMGAGTTAVAAKKLKRHFIGCDINPEYVRLANERVANTAAPS